MLTALNPDTGERVNIEPMGDAVAADARVWVETYRNVTDCSYKPARMIGVVGDRARVKLDDNLAKSWKPVTSVFVAVQS